MRMSPLWRLDVIGDIAEAVERIRQHAPVDCLRELDRRYPGRTLEHRLHAFRCMCTQGGVELPQNLEAPLVLDDQFKGRNA